MLGSFFNTVANTVTSFADDLWEGAKTVGSNLMAGKSAFTDTAVGSFLNANPIIGKAAGYAFEGMFGKDGGLKSPAVRGQRMSSVPTSAGSSRFESSAADMGFTDRVQNAMRTAYRSAPQNSVIGQSIAAIRAKQATGPLLQISQPAIAVRKTTKAAD